MVWRFKSRPEYITVGSRFIFREGLTKGIGKVKKIIPIDEADEAFYKTVTLTNDSKHELSPQKLKMRNNISPVNHEIKKLKNDKQKSEFKCSEENQLEQNENLKVEIVK